MSGRNRRAGNPEIMLSGGILRCGVCGYAITGENILRKPLNGDCNIHVYYKCGNNQKAGDHPPVRWREAEVEKLVLAELDGIRIQEPRVQGWLRNAIEEAFADLRRSTPSVAPGSGSGAQRWSACRIACSTPSCEARWTTQRSAQKESRSTGSPNRPFMKMVGASRFELETSCTPSKRATRLRYAPT